jgi:AraC-like DNA-binding protein
VASLAEEVGLSRSVFAARFTQLVGEPPLGYLTRLRMQKAATLLREGATLAKGLAPDGLRFGGVVQPGVSPVGGRGARCVPQAPPQVVSERRLA